MKQTTKNKYTKYKIKRPKYPQIAPVYYLAIETETGLKAARIRARSFNTAKVLLTERLGQVEHFQVNADWKGQNLPDGTPYLITLI